MAKWQDMPIVELIISLLVLMALFAAMKLVLAKLPDGGILGDLKHFFMLA
jgi:hypothetical protein